MRQTNTMRDSNSFRKGRDCAKPIGMEEKMQKKLSCKQLSTDGSSFK
jgi:hypothetical protein